MVNTVTGPISPDKLGQTLIHEHFVCAQEGWFADYSIAPYSRSAALKANLKVCKAAQDVGISTIVDCTPNDFPRDPVLFRQLADKTGMNIICVTGLFNEEMGGAAYWKVRVKYLKKDISKYIAELFVKELTDGIGKTGIRAGAIKIATGETISPYEEAMFKGAVAAQKATGAPIITHTEGPHPGPAQAALLMSEGADMKRVIIGHVSNSTDLEYQRSLAEKAYVGFDRLGFGLFTNDEICVNNIAELCKLGMADRILMSHDSVNFWAARSVLEEAPPGLKALIANWKIDHISKDIIPALKAKGVTDEQVRTMMVDNPRKLLAGK